MHTYWIHLHGHHIYCSTCSAYMYIIYAMYTVYVLYIHTIYYIIIIVFVGLLFTERKFYKLMQSAA